MSATRTKKIRNLIKRMEKIANQADELDLTLGNGGEVGSLIMTMAFDITEANPATRLLVVPPQKSVL